MKLPKEATELLGQYVKTLAANHQVGNSLRARFESIDRALERESDRTQRAIEKIQAQLEKDPNRMPNIELPVTFIQYDSALAYLAGVFATGYPMFRSTSNPDLEEVASMMSALIGRDQSRFSWTPQMIKALGCVLRYNLCAMEVSWKSKYAIGVSTSVEDNNPRTGSTKSVVYEGNSIEAIDLYNFFYDTSCDIDKVHEEGVFAGYIQRFNYIRFRKFMHNLDDTYKVMGNLKGIYESGNGLTNYYYTPNIRMSENTTSLNGSNINWEDYFGLNSFNRTGGEGAYEILTCYARIIPVEFKIHDVPSKSIPQVWKLIVANGRLVYAEPIIAGHEYLPIVVGQLYDNGFGMQGKSFVENLMSMQQASSSAMNGLFGVMRRTVADRGLYNPAMIRPDDINSSSPRAKIPVKMNKYNNDFTRAYQPMDFRDNVTPYFSQNLQTILGIANETNGVNQASQGNFVRGNKTLFEFQTTMTNADARLQTRALVFEGNVMFPIKQMIKINYLLYATDELVYEAESQREVRVQPQELRDRSPELKMADGLIPATKLANTEVIMAAYNFMGQSPQLAMEYDVGKMLVSTIRQQGFDDLEKYRRTPEQQRQYIQQMQALQQPQGSAPGPAPGSPSPNPQGTS